MDNLNISFAPDKSAEDKGRINAVEDYLSLLTERIKFCLNGIDENIAQKSDGEEEKQLIYSTIADEVGQFTNTDKNCEVFNDYKNNVASAYYSHAEGYKTTASAPYSHAEGSNTIASNPSCHAEGTGCVASGQSSHAEGENCRATGSYSHAEGHNTVASGIGSHASGWGTVAGDETFAIGRWNKTSKGLFVVGNGHDSYYGASRSDALVLDGNGNLCIAGKLTAHTDQSVSASLGIEIHGAARLGYNWTSDRTDILLAVGNGGDSNRLQDALTLDSGGNLHISGKLTADGGVGYVLPPATADTLGGVKIGDNISVTADGAISVNLSAYLKNTDIADWAKAESKPVYTAEEVGAAENNHTHNMSDITDMPEWTKTENKPDYTASEVGAATAADITAAVNAVEIGGRNLLPNTNDMSLYAKTATVTASVDNEGYSVVTFAKQDTAKWYGFASKPNIRYLQVRNKQVTISFEYRSDDWVLHSGEYNGPVVAFALNNISEISNKRDKYASLYDGVAPSADWQKYEKTVTITDSYLKEGTATLTNDSWLFVQILSYSMNHMQIRKIKLEIGNKATDWSPAPEDDERRIASLEARVAALEAAAVSGGEV